MIKRLVVGLVAAVLWAVPALGQLPGGSEIAINKTPVIGGTSGLCLYVTSANKVGNQACSTGSVTTFSAGTTGFTPNSATSGAVTLAGTLVGANGGTGVANTGKTITLGGNLTTSGAFASTFTMTNTTAVTFPTSGTLATVGGNLGVFTGTSLALGGATIGSNALAVTGTTALGDALTITPATANATPLTLTGGTITAAAPSISVSRTWNNSGVTFTSLLFNITDTASAAGSLLIDLQVGGASKFSVAKTGTLTSVGDVVIGPAPTSTGNVTLASSATFPNIAFKNGSTILTQLIQNAAGSNFFWDIPSVTINWRDTLGGGTTVATLNSNGAFTAVGTITAKSLTAVGAGANTQAFIKASTTANLGVYYGTGDPGFTAAKGSLYVKTDATTTTTRLWVNTDGGTTWASFTSSS